MSLSEIYTTGGLGILCLLTLFELTPIHINPWSAIAKFIGNALNKELTEKIENQAKAINKLQSDLNDLRKTTKEDNAQHSRYRILRFNDELRQGTKHSKEHFDQILDDITKYENFCRRNPDFPNEKAVLAIANIREVYRECGRDNSFL